MPCDEDDNAKEEAEDTDEQDREMRSLCGERDKPDAGAKERRKETSDPHRMPKGSAIRKWVMIIRPLLLADDPVGSTGYLTMDPDRAFLQNPREESLPEGKRRTIFRYPDQILSQ